MRHRLGLWFTSGYRSVDVWTLNQNTCVTSSHSQSPPALSSVRDNSLRQAEEFRYIGLGRRGSGGEDSTLCWFVVLKNVLNQNVDRQLKWILCTGRASWASLGSVYDAFYTSSRGKHCRHCPVRESYEIKWRQGRRKMVQSIGIGNIPGESSLCCWSKQKWIETLWLQQSNKWLTEGAKSM